MIDNTFRESAAWAAYLDVLTRQRAVGNVPCDTIALHVRGQNLPVTVNLEGDASTSWVASLRNVYGPYARAEARLVGLSTAARIGSDLVSHVGEGILALAGLSGGLYLNNWLISTNLHQADFNLETVLEARESLRSAYPGVPLVVRSLMLEHHADFMADLVDQGFLLVPTRQVWLMDCLADGSYKKRKDVKKDLSFERQQAGQSTWVPSIEFSDEDWCRVALMYAGLYRGKYPKHNPDYSAKLLIAASEAGWLEAQGLRGPDGQLSGAIGWIRRPGWMACPLLGYDLAAPIEQGLYRRLNLRAFQVGEQEGRIMHCSGGAGLFKQTRGARHVVEYAAVYAEVAGYRKAALHALSGSLRRWAVPYLQSKAL